jgi:hypothetical protein
MRIRLLFIYALVLCSVLGLAGCKDSSTALNSGGETVFGDLLGTILLTDQHAHSMSDNRGVLIQIEGTSYSALSDSAGNWVIHNLPSRSYAITFSKPGFYTRRDASFSFMAGVPVRYRELYGDGITRLGALPEFTVTLDAIVMPTAKYIDSLKMTIYTTGSLYGHTSNNAPDSTTVGMYVLISKNPNLNIDDPSSYFFIMPVNGLIYATHDTVVNLGTTLSYSWFYSEDVKAGDMIYFKAYPVIGNPMQYDPIENKNVFIGYSSQASNRLSATMQ